MGTYENLMAAFAGESQANRKYLAFAKKAEEEGFPQIAKLFRSAAEAETIHAHAHLRVLDGVKSTVDNLKAAIEGEGYEFKTMYPEFLEVALKEGNKKAEVSFKNALAVEKIHYDLYSEALSLLQSGKDMQKKEIYVCPVCGNTVIGEAPDKFSICGVMKDKFTKIV
jgi:rubrerythrin